MARASRKYANNSVERKIYFYRIDAGLDDAGRPVRFDPSPFLRHIDTLPFNHRGRYWEETSDNVTCCWVDRHEAPQRVRIANLRRSDLPQLEDAGALFPLQIPVTAGLAEQIHVVFFPNLIAGSDFNFYGPRISRLARYLYVKTNGNCPPVTFQPLLRQDVAQQLARLQDVRMLSLKVSASYVAALSEADTDIVRYIGELARAGDAQEVEVTLSPKRYSRDPLSNRLLDFARKLAYRADLRSEASRFVLRGWDPETGRVELVDLLSDELIVKRHILRQDSRTRALDRESAYGAIEEAYGGLREQLENASAIR